MTLEDFANGLYEIVQKHEKGNHYVAGIYARDLLKRVQAALAGEKLGVQAAEPVEDGTVPFPDMGPPCGDGLRPGAVAEELCGIVDLFDAGRIGSAMAELGAIIADLRNMEDDRDE